MIEEVTAVLEALKHVRRAEIGGVKGYRVGKMIRLDITPEVEPAQAWNPTSATAALDRKWDV